MLELKKATIVKEIFSRSGIAGYWADVEGIKEKCIAYSDLISPLKPGDQVILNTTAVSLQLGSGGYHFVVANVSNIEHEIKPGGHIMKMRYSPMQVKVFSAEEPASPLHDQINTADLENIPVLAATLHSMLAPLCLKLKEEDLQVVYIMTDGAALPIAFSETVDWLKKEKMLNGTVTIGHAFGGDLEAVNIYSGLLAAKAAFDPDVIIVSMGPGIVGTGTKWGFTGIEQGEVLNAVEALHGIPIAVPRISFADKRQRHQGISHHTMTVLEKVCRVQAIVPLPNLQEEQNAFILGQLSKGLLDQHFCCFESDNAIIESMEKSQHHITTMGRDAEEDRAFFLSLGASAQAALKIRQGKPLNRINWA